MAGLVILLGDDPGGYGSQNDQDTRTLAPLLQVPWLEPDGPAEGFAMMREAFEASERLQLPIIVRETRSFTLQTEPIDVPEGPYRQPNLGLARERWRFVPVPSNVVEKNRALHAAPGGCLPVGRGPAVQPDSWKRAPRHRGRGVRLPEAA